VTLSKQLNGCNLNLFFQESEEHKYIYYEFGLEEKTLLTIMQMETSMKYTKYTLYAEYETQLAAYSSFRPSSRAKLLRYG